MSQVAYISFTTKDLASFMNVVVDVLTKKMDIPCKLTADGPARNQGTVDSCFRDIERCNLYIALVGHRLGWVPEHPDNPHGLSIVELEYLHAEKCGIPRLVFVGDDTVTRANMDTDCTAIDRFREKLLSGYERSPKKFSYNNPERLGTEVIAAVTALEINNPAETPQVELTQQQEQLKQKLISNASDSITDAQISTVYESLKTTASVEAWLLKRWTYWARRSPGFHTSAGQLHSTFVNLQLQLQSDDNRILQPEIETLESESHGERTVLYRQLTHALHSNSSQALWVLLGPPGAGKSTVLQHYELTTIERTLKVLETGAEKKPELCIWIRLSTYKPASGGDCPDPQQWLETQWRKIAPALPSLAMLQADFKLRFLLDGLNEIPAPLRDAATERWSDWAEDCRSAGLVLPPVFSVRQHEYFPVLQLPNDRPAEIHLRLWQSEQITQYIDKQLGTDSPLAAQITADNKLVEFYGLPLNLHHLCELYASPDCKQFLKGDASQLLYQRGRLYIGMLWLRLQRLLKSARQRLQLTDTGLLTPRQCLALEATPANLQVLRDLLEKCPLVAALKTQALTMQHRGTQVSVEFNSVAPDLKSNAREALISALEAMRIADVEIDQFRFVHQQWQEFFAALALAATAPQSTRLPDFSDAGIHSLKPFQEAVAELTVSQSLSAAPVGRWAETARLLLELSDAKQAWFAQMASGNFPLAAYAAEPVRKQLPQEKVAALSQTLLLQMQDPQVDLRQRLLYGQVLPMAGDPRHGEHRPPGKSRYQIPTDDHLIRIPAGSYQLGSLHGDNDEHCEGQLPQVVLTEFRLSFAPVTNAEYACFINAGGYTDDRWWVEKDSLRWRNGELANTTSEQTVRKFRKDYLESGATGCQEKYGLTEHQLAQWGEVFGVSDEDFEQRLKALFAPPGKPFTEPKQWRNPVYNNPAQPVVGVCWFEAAAYCEWLSGQSDRHLRLPTEAQWEVAARGSDTREYPWGDKQPEQFQINADPAHLLRTSPVGVFAQADTPTQLTDMAGNVLEWCADWYGGYLPGPTTNPCGPNEGGNRVLRGGSWFVRARHCRSAYRNRVGPSFRGYDVGFRFAQVDQPRSVS